jgi:hypothetical protein
VDAALGDTNATTPRRCSTILTKAVLENQRERFVWMNFESPCPNTLASRATFLIVCTLPGRRYSTTHRPALERAACECCAIIKSEYDRVLGPGNLG